MTEGTRCPICESGHASEGDTAGVIEEHQRHRSGASGTDTPVQREQRWLRERVGAPKEPRIGCSRVAHDRLGFCAACVPRDIGGEAERARAENLGWQVLALRQDEVAANDERVPS